MLQQDITNALNERGGVLCMHNGGDGHCIVPYAVYPQPNGDYTIETYNPNVPYSPSEVHAAALSQSRITVHSSNNTFQLGDGSEFSGGLDNIIFFPMSLFDSPSPPLGLGILKVIFGGAQGPGIKTTQIADADGHVLLNPNGSWNTNPATRIPDSAALPIYGKAIPGTSVFVLSSLGSYTQTIESHAAGEYQINLAGHDFGVQLHGVPSNAGDTETISYSPASNSFGFKTTATSKPFDVQRRSFTTLDQRLRTMRSKSARPLSTTSAAFLKPTRLAWSAASTPTWPSGLPPGRGRQAAIIPDLGAELKSGREDLGRHSRPACRGRRARSLRGIGERSNHV